MTVPFQNLMPFIGVVQGQQDPVTAFGRIKVRCYGIHPPAHDTNVPVEHLPWSIVVDPTIGGGLQTTGMKPGEWVFGFFLDGRDAQYPIVLGSLPGLRMGNLNNPWADMAAAAHAAELPKSPQMTSTDVHITGQPVAAGAAPKDVKLAGGANISFPEPAYSSDNATSINSKEYGGNFIMAGDHVTMHHKSGSVIQVNEVGDVVIQSATGDIWINSNNSSEVTRSSKNITVQGGSYRLKIDGGHCELDVEGNMTHKVRGDYNLKVSGKFNVNVGEQFEVQAAKVGLHTYTDSINLTAKNGVYIISESDMSIAANNNIDFWSRAGDLNIEIAKAIGMKAFKSIQVLTLDKIKLTGHAGIDIRANPANVNIDGTNTWINSGKSSNAVPGQLKKILPTKTKAVVGDENSAFFGGIPDDRTSIPETNKNTEQTSQLYSNGGNQEGDGTSAAGSRTGAIA